MKKISVVIPAYNCADSIGRLLETILHMPLVYEVVVVNDGSKDATLEVCEKYRCYSQLKILSQINQGPAVARNIGLENITGDYVWFVDSDDDIYNNSLEIINEYLEEMTDILCFGIEQIHIDTGISEYVKPDCQVIDGSNCVRELIKSKLYNSPCNKIIRKDFLKKNGISFNNLPLIEDVDFVNQLMLKKPNIRLIDHCLYKYKIEDSRIDSISSRYYKERFEMSVKMNLDYMNVLKKYKSDDLEMLNYIGAKLLQDMYKVFWHEYVVFSNEKGKEQKEVELRSLLRNKGLINQIKKSKANCTSENIFKKCLCFGNGTIIKGYFRIRKIFYVYKHK